MMIVDTHCHALPHWFEPVETLLHQMNANGVEKATLVQVRGQFDNRYIMECVQRFPGRFSAVAIVDTDTADAPETLAHWVNMVLKVSASVRRRGRPVTIPWPSGAKLPSWASQSVAWALQMALPHLSSSKWSRNFLACPSSSSI